MRNIYNPRIILFFCLSVFFLNVIRFDKFVAYGQNQMEPISRLDEGIVVENNDASLSDLERLIESLSFLGDVDQYQVNLTLTNLRSRETTADIEILVDKATGNSKIIFDYYNRLTNPNHHQLTLYAYDHFSNVYVSLFDWLDSLAYFKQAFFSVDDASHFQQFKNVYVELNSNDLKLNNDPTLFYNQLVLLPTKQKLAMIDEKKIFEIDDIYYMNLLRTEIPEQLFQESQGVNLLVKTTIEKNKEKFSIRPSLEIKSRNHGMSFRTEVDSQLSRELLASNSLLDSQRILPDNSFDLGITTDQISEKLRRFELLYNAQSKFLEIRIEGITEMFNLNIFSDQTANFKSYEFGSVYRFQPLRWEMPDLLALERISHQELQYLLNNLSQLGGEYK